MNAATQGGDLLINLPTDDSMPTHDELQIINALFRKNKVAREKILEETKEPLVLIVLFIIFSIKPVDDLIKKFIPITSASPYILLAFKGVALAAFFYVIKNFCLLRK